MYNGQVNMYPYSSKVSKLLFEEVLSMSVGEPPEKLLSLLSSLVTKLFESQRSETCPASKLLPLLSSPVTKVWVGHCREDNSARDKALGESMEGLFESDKVVSELLGESLMGKLLGKQVAW